MKVSANWLQEWVDAGISVDEIAEKLTMSGCEVDGIEAAAPDFSGIVVAEIQQVEPHPDADKLRVCQVNKGDETVQIVCGAPNVYEGMLAPLATVGGVLSGKEGKPFKIKKAKLRGVESFGMLCSAVELGLAAEADGLWDLPKELTVGDDLREALALNDVVLDIDLTPNRADCLSMRGIAREVGVLTRADVVEPTVTTVPVVHDGEHPIAIEATIECPTYLARLMTGINNQLDTPLWLAERLRRAGIRPLTPAVDITNYVLLEWGQPMHAFDADKLQGEITVRMAAEGESLELLGGQTIKLTNNALVIVDTAGPIALAGIMGGQRTAVDENTTNILLEAAHFVPTAIAGRARQFGLHTDSSHRFERGVDPQLPELAMQRATGLLLDIAGGQAGAVVAAGESAPEPQAVLLRRARIEKVLGLRMSDAEIEEILRRLDMQLTATGDGWQVTPPSSRFDIAIEVDLIEELARIHGYSEFPVSAPLASVSIKPIAENAGELSEACATLIERGYFEAITYSFVEPSLQQALFPELDGLVLANPISADLSVMRVSLWPGLLGALQRNVNRQQSRVRLFETGLRFVPDVEADGGIRQEAVIAGLAYGSIDAEQWGQESQPVDFYAVKADVAALFGARAAQLSFTATEHSALHPGQTATISVDGEPVGTIGALHPKFTKQLGLTQVPLLFELTAAAVQTRVVPAFQPISKFPAVRRDLALVVQNTVSAAELLTTAEQTVAETLKDVKLEARVFDVFAGDSIKSGHKSIALALVLQDFSATLTDEKVENAMLAVTQKLSSQHAAEIRS